MIEVVVFELDLMLRIHATVLFSLQAVVGVEMVARA